MSVSGVVTDALKEGRTMLTEVEAKELLKESGISIVETRLARTKKEALFISKEMGFPVVLKVVSPDIIHKSDVGGVKLGLKSGVAVSRAYDEIVSSVRQNKPDAKVLGVSVQRMARQGIEVIIGVTKDIQFGPVIMFGLGGILVEVLKDVSFRIIPITGADASQMVRELKAFPLLQGYRGQEPANIPLLEDALLKVSAFIEKHPEVKELDLNPVFAYKNGVLAVDARVVLEEGVSR
ncbi:MAG: acetate--CoA ligase family protein [Chloroflexi bacterium]|nr:acetate--CoA ligase family protein [Chloroflexota bacterium]